MMTMVVIFTIILVVFFAIYLIQSYFRQKKASSDLQARDNELAPMCPVENVKRETHAEEEILPNSNLIMPLRQPKAISRQESSISEKLGRIIETKNRAR